MATAHNMANPGDIAKTVIMSGDPLRIKQIAEDYLENPRLVNNIRNQREGKPVEERNYIPVTGIYGESCGCPNNGMVNYREHIKEKS